MHNVNDAFDSISEGFGVYSVLIKAFISIMWACGFGLGFYPLEKGHNGIF